MEAENREVLKRNGLFIWLTADMRTIVQRMKNDKAGAEQRPPLFGVSSEREASETLKERMPIYRELAHLTVGNNGTAMRFLTSLVSLGNGVFTLGGDPRLCERPMKPLLDALKMLGVDVRSKNKQGYPPVVVYVPTAFVVVGSPSPISKAANTSLPF
jgi:5-enolpyruvylshikimate-3-phosphate synthase